LRKLSYYLLHSYDLMKVFYGLGSGVRQSMSYTEMKKLPILLPPLEEQQEIVEFLRVKVHENETLVEMLKKVIEKLKEYRQSLIYEAVTGKIDVRDMEVD
ncbi:restriction endonuclease subunit S, partial [Ureibacillus thermosphaericus]|uniref:restriction endonuclease subunit S n=1 Tax=Ureibacillus thermosphaericus TaxID=51173 RepID=UPI0030C995D0